VNAPRVLLTFFSDKLNEDKKLLNQADNKFYYVNRKKSKSRKFDNFKFGTIPTNYVF